MERNKQVEAAEDAQRATVKAMHDVASYMTVEEKAAAERARLYATLKARNALDIYYSLYPDERPKGNTARVGRTRDEDDRER